MTSNTFDELNAEPAGMPVPARVLTIGAHPDDAEFGAGATLARWASEGSDITILVITDGSKGSWDVDIDQDELIRRRKAEQADAAAVLGAAATVHLDHVDGELENSAQLREQIAIEIRRHTPDVVLTHDPWQRYQMHPDHRATGIAAVDGVVSAREPLALMDSGFDAHRPSAVLLWSADEPDHGEPVTDEWFERKVNALLCHSSQGETTMIDAPDNATQRTQFASKLRQWHTDQGAKLELGPAEVFKRLTP